MYVNVVIVTEDNMCDRQTDWQTLQTLMPKHVYTRELEKMFTGQCARNLSPLYIFY